MANGGTLFYLANQLKTRTIFTELLLYTKWDSNSDGGERADHLTTTTALAWLVLAKYLISEWSSYAKFCIGSSMGKMLQSFGPI